MPTTQGKRRTDLTFRGNVERGRHGWLRLTPAYSVRLVSDVLSSHGPDLRVLDPFSGTATTVLCAAEQNDHGYGVDINPFLVWLGNVKVAHYSSEALGSMVQAARAAAEAASSPSSSAVEPPPLRNIDRWWSDESLSFLCRLKAAIDTADAYDERATDLLRVAFCRTLIALSNAAFNHQSMSFREPKEASDQPALFSFDAKAEQFLSDVQFVAASAGDNPTGDGRVVEGDSVDLRGTDEPFDVVVTSPPYPNRMSYIRELRPYMYWLGYLETAREAAELDWSAIGGTWGVATSRLRSWEPADGVSLPRYLPPIIEAIRGSHEKNGQLMANYVHKYFEDMRGHLRSLHRALKPGAQVHYIVGNSTFYGHLLPVERVYADLLAGAGFEKPTIEVVRKRNSKKELFEYLVSATWP